MAACISRFVTPAYTQAKFRPAKKIGKRPLRAAGWR
jgi:hypothetical protein